MINEPQGGEVCRSPTSPPSRDGLRIGPGRAPPRILRGTRPGCSAAAAAASEHKWSARARRPPALRLPPSGPAPLFAAPLPPARRRSGAAPAACGGTSGPRRSPSRPAWLGLSAPALARRSGGSRPPSAALRVGLRPGPARAQLARRCAAGRPWAAPGSLRSPSAPLRAPLRPVSGSLRPGPPLRRPCGGCAAAAPPLALRGSAAGPLAGLRPAFSGPRPRGWGGLGRRCGGVAALRQLGGSAAGIQSVATLKARQGGPGIHANRYALASPHSQSLSAKAYSNVTSGRSCCSASCTLRRS